MSSRKQILSLIVFFGLLSGLSGAVLDFANSEIVVLKSRYPELVSEAVQELSWHLQLLSGCTVPVVQKGTAGRFQFVLGAAPQQVPLAKTEARYSIRDDKVYLWGFCKPAQFNGYFNAVDFFLERELGVRWIKPGSDGIQFTPMTECTLPAHKDFTWTLPFEQVAQRAGSGRFNQAASDFLPPELRRSPEVFTALKEENVRWLQRMHHGIRTKIRYGHAFRHWWDTYSEQHPEYFGMNPYGKRTIQAFLRDRIKLCVSNPAVADQVIQEWEAKNKPQYLNICPNDGTPGFCFCPECLKLDTRTENENFYDHLTDRYLFFWNRVAGLARAKWPDVMVTTYIYSYYRHPPRREKVEYPDNLLFGIVPTLGDDNQKLFSAWKEAGVKHIFLRPNDLCYNGGFFRGCERIIFDKFQVAKNFSLFGTDYDGAPGNPVQEFEHFVVARMIAFPELTFEQIEDEYLSYYGQGAAKVREFFAFQRRDAKRRLDDATAALRQEQQDLLDDSLFAARIIREADKYYSPAAMAEGEQLLASALAAESREPYRQRLQRLLLLQQQAALMLDFITQGRKQQEGGPSQLEESAEKLLAFRLAHAGQLQMDWETLYNRTERAFWLLTSRYADQAQAASQGSAGSPQLFRDSFDLPAMDGWSKRERFLAITNKTASFDKYSIQLAAAADEGIGICKPAVPVKPGKYRISFDARMDAGVANVRLRIVGGGKTLVNVTVPPAGDFWKEAEKEFSVPDDLDEITLYIIVGEGKTGLQAYVDNIVLTRLEP